MSHDSKNQAETQKRAETSLWTEILSAALTGLYPSDQQLERMLDKLERLP